MRIGLLEFSKTKGIQEGNWIPVFPTIVFQINDFGLLYYKRNISLPFQIGWAGHFLKKTFLLKKNLKDWSRKGHEQNVFKI